eukprot:TRINITY_DN5903_c0_g3_i2.p1 TRINITY_DN5903_c0_g3~~TRINITY_DN5903_c0_g3_i2.p1  ORF type:complete len:411 (+),score=24.11 TRINITY_DN5903_c0_g3_i2:64-1233(+)
MAFRTLCSILSTMWSPVESARAFVPYEFELESSLMYDFGVDPTAPTRCCCSGPSRHECRLMDRENIVPDNFNFWCPQGTALAGAFEQDYSINLTDTCRRERRRVNVTVKAYWVRHGLSCANALQAHPGYRVGKFMLYRDPKLTSLGIHRARALGELIRTKILNSTRRNQVLPSSKPLVFSSAMSRAVETALWNFPEWDVRPIPYIAENGITLDNIPLSTWNTQKEQMLVPPMTERKLQRVVFDDEGTKSHPSRSGLQKKSSYDSFRRYLPGLLDDILEDVEFGREKEPEIPVIIVSHGHYIRWSLAPTTQFLSPRSAQHWSCQVHQRTLRSFQHLLHTSARATSQDARMVSARTFPLTAASLAAESSQASLHEICMLRRRTRRCWAKRR